MPPAAVMPPWLPTIFTFSDGSEITLVPKPTSRRLEETTGGKVSVKINRYECVMIDTDITEGNCYEVLINGTVTGKLNEDMELGYTKRMADDKFCAQKANMLSIGWQLYDAAAESDSCRFDSGKAYVVGKSFGILTTFTQQETSVAEIDTGVLTALLIMAMVIFVILFIGLAYALWVYVHPEDLSSLNNLWSDFDEQRRENLQRRQRERMNKREQMRREQQEYLDMQRMLDGEEEDFVDVDDNNNINYQNVLNYQPNEEEQAPFQNALRGTNQSSQLAQMIAESTQIFQDDTMMKEEDIGEN